MLAMMDIIGAGGDGQEQKIGSMHQDGRGFAAWDANSTWLGKTSRSRFRTQADALKAILSAHEQSHGPVKLVGARVSR